MITRSEVFSRVSSALKTEFGKDVFVVGERTATPSKFPCVWVVESDTYPMTRYMTIDCTDEQRMSMFEVQAFSNLSTGGTSQASALVECATKAFLRMGYRCMSNMPLDNSDPSIKRHTARFQRVIGGGDTLPPID